MSRKKYIKNYIHGGGGVGDCGGGGGLGWPK